MPNPADSRADSRADNRADNHADNFAATPGELRRIDENRRRASSAAGGPDRAALAELSRLRSRLVVMDDSDWLSLWVETPSPEDVPLVSAALNQRLRALAGTQVRTGY